MVLFAFAQVRNLLKGLGELDDEEDGEREVSWLRVAGCDISRET